MEKRSKSLKKSLSSAIVIIILLMLIPTLYSIAVFRFYTVRYDRIIMNVSSANSLRKIAKEELEGEIWEVVSGLKSFNDGRQYLLLREVRIGIAGMMDETSEASLEILEVASRTEKTLEKYVVLLGEQIVNHEPVSKNEEVMEQIRGVASVLNDVLQEYIVTEIESAESANIGIRRWSFNLFLIQLAISVIAFLIAMYAFSVLSRRIGRPVRDMEILSSRIASGDLEARAMPPRVEELDHLAENLNTMAGHIQALIDENVREQKNLQKAEMKALQAQITPHFLYNTLDTIVWLAEDNEMDEVVEITKAFSAFFRISLSRGHEWITLSQEMEHAASYLKIQGIRYRDILEYQIECDEGIADVPVLKLLLQPLVENAIYHGIKNKRGRGRLVVSAHKVSAFGKEDGGVRFCVEDNGIGFTEKRMHEVQNELALPDGGDLKASYGLYNVNKRLRLYYDGLVSLHIESLFGEGSAVSFVVPCKFEMLGEEGESV
ncbi:MAG: sensor histidine kinase [Treponema sp.]|nr:sensor histidine kinase [Treponema sp.]